MLKAICSTLIVLVCGFLGCMLNEAFCILGVASSATGCIVYAIQSKKSGD